MSNKLRELQARKANLVKDARTLTDIAAAEDRDMTTEELSAFESLKSKIESATNAIDREAALIATNAAITTETNARTTALTAETNARTAAVSSETSARVSAISSVVTAVSSETSARASAITSAVSAEAAARVSAISSVVTAVSSEAAARDAAISNAIASLVDSAPSALDTLNEIALALGNDGNLAGTLTNSIASVEAAVSAEAVDRDSAISAAVSAEVIDRGAAISAAVSAETTARTAALTAETSARVSALALKAPLANPTFTGNVIMSLLHFDDDTYAAAGGIPLDGLYRTGNVVKIRIA